MTQETGPQNLQELSKNTLKNYVKKAAKSSEKNWKKVDQEEDKAMATDGNKYPEKQARHTKNASAFALKGINRDKGIKLANKKLKEETEESPENVEGQEEVTQEINETAASETITPTPTHTKSELIAKLVSYASKADKETLAQAVETVLKPPAVPTANGVRGAEINKPTDVSAAANMATIKTHIKEDLDSTLEGLELTEEFKDKASILFEAAVEARIAILEAELTEANEKALVETIDAVKKELEEGINEYLTYIANEWLEENELAVENGIKNEIMESLFSSLKNVLIEHNIELPEDKVNVVDSLAEEVAELEESLNNQKNKVIELTKEIENLRAAAAFEEISEGLSVTDKDKLMTLVENISYATADEFKKKALVIKESTFKTASTISATEEQMLTEGQVEQPTPEVKDPAITPTMAVYLDALKRSSAK